MNVVKGIIFHVTVFLTCLFLCMNFDSFLMFFIGFLIVGGMIGINYLIYKKSKHSDFLKYSGFGLFDNIKE